MKKLALLISLSLLFVSCQFLYRPSPYPFTLPAKASRKKIIQLIIDHMISFYTQKDLKNYLQLFYPLSSHYTQIKNQAMQDFKEYQKIQIQRRALHWKKNRPKEVLITFSVQFKAKGKITNHRKVAMESTLRFLRENGAYKLYALQSQPLKKMPASIPRLPKPKTKEEKEIMKSAQAIQRILSQKQWQKLKPYLHSRSPLQLGKRREREQKTQKKEEIQIDLRGGRAFVRESEANLHLYFYASISETFPYTNRFNSTATAKLILMRGIWKIESIEFHKKKS